MLRKRHPMTPMHHKLVQSGLVAAALAWAVCLVMATGAAKPRVLAQTGPWRPVLKGLYGDHVVTLVLTGEASQQHRPLVLLPQDQGLFRSIDDGQTWAPVLADPNRPAAVALAATRAYDDPTGERLYAGLRFAPTLSMSVDGGQTWAARAGPAGLTRLDRLAASKSGRLYVGERSTAATLWTSTDRGESWERHDLGPTGITGRIDDLFAAPDDPVVYLISGQALYRSTDDPADWTVVLGPATDPAVAVGQAAIGPRGRLYAAGKRAADSSYAVLASPDRGDTWPSAGWPADADAAPRALAAGEPSEALPVVWLALDNGQVHRSDDAAASWRRLRTLPVPPTTLTADPGNLNVWVGSDGLGLFLADPQWGQTGAVPVEALGIVAPNYSVDRMVYLNARIRPERREGTTVRPALHAFYHAVAGEDWTRVDNTELLGENLLASPDFARDKRLYSGKVISHDKGTTWESLPPRAPGGVIPSVAAVGPLTRTQPVVYALEQPYTGDAGGRGLVRSEDGGRTWDLAEADVNGIVAVAISPAYAEDRTVFFGTDRGLIYRAVNGLDFDVQGRIPALAPQRILYDLVLSPSFRTDQTLYAAVEDAANEEDGAAVFVSSDGGESWAKRAAGLDGAARPRRLILSPNFPSDRVLFLGGERRATDPPLATLYGTDSAGVEWFAEAVLPPAAELRAFAWGGTLFSGRLFAAAGSAGVWLRMLDGPPGELPTPGPTELATPASPTPTATLSGTPTDPLPTATGATPTPPTPDTPTAPTPVTPPVETGTPTATEDAISATPTATVATQVPPTSPSPTPTQGRPTSATPTPSRTATALPPATTATPPPGKIYLPLGFKARTSRR